MELADLVPTVKPLLHFLLIGGALFALQRAVPPLVRGDPAERIVVPADQVAALRNAWIADTGRDPNGHQLAALVGRVVDEEVLVRTARQLGFHKIDPVVWRRLVENMRFASDATAATGPDGDEHGRNDAELYAEALALGMDESDLVVRRRLAERMSQALKRLGRGTEPSDEEMQDFIARHPQDFTKEMRVRFSHVFLSRQRRGEAITRDAEALRDALVAADSAADRAIAAGVADPSAFPAHFALSSERQIAKVLGTEFAGAVMKIAPARWAGPIESPYGLHFVLVREVRPAALEPLDAVRDRARYGVLREREEHAFHAGIRELRQRYDVRVAGLNAAGVAP